MSSIAQSELILNEDGSVYHLALLPHEISDTIIIVGDPDRVREVTTYFDTIEVTKRKREFITQTGTIGGKRLTVISTGIGPDNIDIVFNELDALVNIDLQTRQIKPNKTQLKIIRIGTSGALQPEIPVDAFVASERGIGLDNLMSYYHFEKDLTYKLITESIRQRLGMELEPYMFQASSELLSLFNEGFHKGWTLTAPGFYGPQGRVLRLQLSQPDYIDRLQGYEYRGNKLTNFEMETAAIYGLSTLLGHKSLSLNAIVANRALGKFSADSHKAVNELIVKTLEILIKHT